MGVPAFLSRKLYKKGSLREDGPDSFAFTMQNPLAKATVIGPPHFTINGVRYAIEQAKGQGLELATLSPEAPFVFDKGHSFDVSFPGRLLRGGNRIHVVVETKEFGRVEIFVEDTPKEYCDIGFEEE